MPLSQIRISLFLSCDSDDDGDDDDDDDDDDEGNLVVLLSVKTSLVLSKQFDNSEIV